MTEKKEDTEKKINPDSFYEDIEGVCDHPEKKIGIKIERSMEDIRKKKEIQNAIKQENKPSEIMPPTFDSKQYQEKENKKLEEAGSNVRVYNKTHYNTMLTILIGVIIIFGLFFVWSVSNDKFKSDFECPDCSCPKSQLTCPTIEHPDCICSHNLTCPEVNMTSVVNAINSLNMSNSSGGL